MQFSFISKTLVGEGSYLSAEVQSGYSNLINLTIINELGASIETNAPRYQQKRFVKFAIPSVQIISIALNRMVISFNTCDNSVMFSNQYVHVIISTWTRTIISSSTCNTWKYLMLVFFNFDYKNWIYLNKHCIVCIHFGGYLGYTNTCVCLCVCVCVCVCVLLNSLYMVDGRKFKYTLRYISIIKYERLYTTTLVSSS